MGAACVDIDDVRPAWIEAGEASVQHSISSIHRTRISHLAVDDVQQSWDEAAEAFAATLSGNAPNLLTVIDGWPMLADVACTEENRPIFQAFVSSLSPDGRTPYCYHAVQLVKHGLLTSAVPTLTALRFMDAWHNLGDWYQGYWRHKTQGFRDAVMAGERKLERAVMDSGVRPNGSQICTMSAKVFEALEIDLKDVLLPDGRRVQQSSTTHCLDLFSDGLPSDHDPSELVTMVLHELKVTVERYAHLQLKVRWKGVRINYDPSATDVMSIGSRLRLALRIGPVKRDCAPITPVLESVGRDKPISLSLDTLLRPFVGVNATCIPQPAVNQHHKIPAKGTIQDYTPAWPFINAQLCRLRPIEYGGREQVISTVIDALRQKTQAGLDELKLKPTGKQGFLKHSLLISYDEAAASSADKGRLLKIKRYGLHDNESGFAAALRACFVRDDLSVEEYEDMIEQRLFDLHEHAIAFISTKAERSAAAERKEDKTLLRKKESEESERAKPQVLVDIVRSESPTCKQPAEHVSMRNMENQRL